MIGATPMIIFICLIFYAQLGVSFRPSFPTTRICTSNGFRPTKSALNNPSTTRLQAFNKKAPEDKNKNKAVENEKKSTSVIQNGKYGLWLDLSEYTKNISIPNIIGGTILGVTITLGGLFGPLFFQYQNVHEVTETNTIEKSVTLFEDILVDLKNSYVDNVNPDKLFETAMSAMLKSLDPYTEYENLGDAKAVQESVSGKYGGVGMIISGIKDLTKNNLENLKVISNTDKTDAPTLLNEQEKIRLSSLYDKGVVVVDAFEGYAYDNNIRVGDRIISIDGKDTTRMNVDEVRNLLRGEPGTEITITLERDQYKKIPTEIYTASTSSDSTSANIPISNPSTEGKILKTVTIKRQQVRMSDVRLATYLGSPKDGVGYIALSGFNADASRDFASAFLMLRYSAPFGLNGLILDLRGNPGGLLDAAVDIASYLVPPNSPIVSAKAKNEPEVIFKSTTEPIRPANMKLAVLVNGGSASASEIVSGAIQDLDAGVILGPERTFGKGLVQKIVPLPYDSALKYTVAKYYTPSGRCIQAVKYLGGRDDVIASTSSTTTTSTIDGNKEDKDQKTTPSTDNSKDSSTNKEESKTNFEKLKEDFIKYEGVKSGNGAMIVQENDRRLFFTAGGRPVKDGGGVEPDIKVEPFKLSTVESNLVAQNVYTDFVTDYIKQNNLRSSLQQVAMNEKVTRENDPRFDQRVAQSAISKFFVLPTQYLYNSLSEYHTQQDNDDNDPSVTASVQASNNKDIQNNIENTDNLYAQMTTKMKGDKTNTVDSTSFYMTPTVAKLPLSTTELSIFKTNGNTNNVINAYNSKYNNKNNKENTGTNGNNNIASSGWEKELFTLKNTKSSTKLTNDKIFQDFKLFINKKYTNNEINLEVGVTEKIELLEKEFRDQGLINIADELKGIKPQITKNIIDEIDKHHNFIYDSIEITLLSRELPDRLLLYRSVVNDPQVEIARKLLTGEKNDKVKKDSLSADNTSNNNKGKLNGNTDNGRSMLTSSTLTKALNSINSLSSTSSSSSTADNDDTSNTNNAITITDFTPESIENAVKKVFAQPRTLDGERISDFKGVYEQTLSPNRIYFDNNKDSN